MITAVLITREKEYPKEILDIVRENKNITEILIKTEADKIWWRYELALQAKNQFIYVQDDDCYVENIQQLIDEFDGNHIVYNCQQHHFDYYKKISNNKIALIGWGAIFNKDQLRVFDKYFKKFPKDKLSLDYCDRTFTYLNAPHKVIIRTVRNYEPLINQPYRDSIQPGYWEKLEEIVNRLKTFDHNMEKIKPKILMVVDQPDWAFGISARDMVRVMSNKYDFKIINWYDNVKDKKHYEGIDLVYLFGHFMVSWVPDDINFNKICTGVRALFGYLDKKDQKDQRQDPKTAKNAQHILRYPIIHTVSKESFKLFKNFHPNVVYVCHGVNTTFFGQKKNYGRKGPLKIGWSGNPTNLVKGIQLVIDTLRGRRDVELKLAEFGDNQLTQRELIKFYQDLDVFIMPSLSEGASLSLMEAMSCGLPIISTATGNWIELQKLGGGITIERTPADIDNAVNKIMSMTTEELRNMGDINRKEMVDNWDWNVKAKEFDKFFQKALKIAENGGPMFLSEDKNVLNKTKGTSGEDGKTIACFDKKWKMMPENYGRKTKEQVDFFLKWALAKYGMKSVAEFNKFYASKKNILEIGFGSGFNMKYIAEHNKKAKITGVDTSETACKNVRQLFAGNKNVKIINQRVLDIDSPNNTYDLIVADGIVHHLEDPKKVIEFLYRKLMMGGHLYVYLYRKMGPIREFVNDNLRNEMQKLTSEECVKKCKPLTKFAQNLSAIKEKIKIEEEISMLGLKPGEYTPHEIFYYGVMKAFWNDAFSFEENNLNNYDWYYPEFARRYDEEEIVKWMDEFGCEYEINYANPNGISLLIKKISKTEEVTIEDIASTTESVTIIEESKTELVPLKIIDGKMGGRWDFSIFTEPKLFGKEDTYMDGARFLDGFGDIEDWGGGTAYFKRFIKQSGYKNIDGSISQFTDIVADLEDYISNTDCIFMRHVLEHNFNWKKVLMNALVSFKNRMALVMFEKLTDKPTEIVFIDSVGRPLISINRSELISYFDGIEWREENFSGEIVFHLWKK